MGRRSSRSSWPAGVSMTVRLFRANNSVPILRSCFLIALLTAATETCSRSRRAAEVQLLGKGQKDLNVAQLPRSLSVEPTIEIVHSGRKYDMSAPFWSGHREYGARP